MQQDGSIEPSTTHLSAGAAGLRPGSTIVLRRSLAGVIASGLLMLATILSEQSWAGPGAELQALAPWTSGDGAPGDNFGIALAQQGDWLAIGAWGKVVPVPAILNGFAEGAVYLYQRDGGEWISTQTLMLPEHSSDANFGAALAFRGDRLLVGAPRVSFAGAVEAGEAYVYQRTGASEWTLQASLASPSPQSDGRHAAAVAWLADDELVIGAPRELDRGQAEAGRVHRYQYDGQAWQFVGSVLPVTAEAGAGFGTALLPWQGGLLVGVPNAGGDDAGAVDQYGDLTSSPLQRLASVFGAAGSFGAALAGDDARLAIGAPTAPVEGIAGAGQVALYLAGPAPLPDQQLSAPTPGDLDRFGAALVLRGDRLWIGEPQADVAGEADEGEVHVYPLTLAGAGAPLTLIDPAPGLSGRLGIALAIESDGSLLVGADLDQVGPNGGQGSVKRFAVDGAGFAPPVQIDRADGAYLERFGSAVAMDGEWAAVGSFLERTEAGAEAGAVYVYRLVDGQWERFQRLLSPDPAIEQRFGVALAVSAEHLAVGAYWDAATGVIDAGAAYVYQFDGSQWLLQSSLRAPEPELQEFFGFDLALAGDRLLVGAPGSDGSDFDEGAAYLYRLEAGQWLLESSLQMPTIEFGAGYGSRVALGSAVALMAAPSTSSQGVPGAGAVGQFKLSGAWVFERRINAPVPVENAGFGADLALTDDFSAIAASTDSSAGTATGAIYVERDRRMVQLTASDALPGDRLGSAIALSGDVLLAGAPGVDIAGQSSQGALYRWRYRDGQWQAEPRQLTSDGSELDGFGLSLAAAGDWAFAGAPFKSVVQPQEGRVYVFAVDSTLFADGFED